MSAARCDEEVWEATGWRSYPCGRPARVLMRRTVLDEPITRKVCGIHARVLERRGYERVGAT